MINITEIVEFSENVVANASTAMMNYTTTHHNMNTTTDNERDENIAKAKIVGYVFAGIAVLCLIGCVLGVVRSYIVTKNTESQSLLQEGVCSRIIYSFDEEHHPVRYCFGCDWHEKSTRTWEDREKPYQGGCPSDFMT